MYRYTRTAPLFYRADLELSQYLISVFCFGLHYWKLLMHVKKFGQWSKLRVMTYRNKWPWEFCVCLRHCLWNCFPTKDPLLSLFCRKWINLLSTRVCLLRQQRGDIFCWKILASGGRALCLFRSRFGSAWSNNSKLILLLWASSGVSFLSIHFAYKRTSLFSLTQLFSQLCWILAVYRRRDTFN